MSTSALDWWNQHKASPGMDYASRRGLLERLTSHRDKQATFRAELDGQNLKDWDATFAEEDASVEQAIKEITEAQVR